MGKTYRDVFYNRDNIPYGKKIKFPRNNRTYYMIFCPECGHEQPYKGNKKSYFIYGACCTSCGHQWMEQWVDYK